MSVLLHYFSLLYNQGFLTSHKPVASAHYDDMDVVGGQTAHGEDYAHADGVHAEHEELVKTLGCVHHTEKQRNRTVYMIDFVQIRKGIILWY